MITYTFNLGTGMSSQMSDLKPQISFTIIKQSNFPFLAGNQNGEKG